MAFWVRLYKIDSPIADWHSWRQADTAAVTRNFIKEGFNPFYPKYDDMSGVSETPIANVNHFRFVEFPVYNIAVYPLYLLFGTADTYHRLVSVLFSLGSVVFVYLITKRYLGILTGLISSLIYALLPFNVFFSRTTLPEPTFLFFALGMVYFVDKYIWAGRSIWAVWGFIFTTVAFLIKPWAIFFIPPLIYSIIKKERTLKKNLKYLWFFILALLPFLFWRLWILQVPEGIPASNWLLNGDGIRFRPAFFWWIISERLGREILGVTGLILFVIGFIVKLESKNLFFHVWAASMFTYFVVFATGNVRHDYYQYIFTPIAAIFLARGFIYFFKGNKDFIPRIWLVLVGLILLPLTFYFTWTQAKELYKINNPAIIEAGRFADKILPHEAVVVAPYNGDSAFLYQINRPGWPVVALPLTELVTDYGVTHYISVNRDDKTNWVLRHFKILEDNPKFVIADLKKVTNPLTLEDPEP